MKKKLRDIVVDGETWKWSLSRSNGDGDGGIQLNVWHPKTKRKLSEWLTGKDRPDSITPKFVAEKIRGYIHLIGQIFGSRTLKK